MTRTQRLLSAPIRDLDSYFDGGGGSALKTARDLAPDEVIDTVARSGLRGRGGAGFPTGSKWRTLVEFASAAEGTPVVVNAAEGEPGTFKDRYLIRQNPYLILEGALIAARAVGSPQVIVATKASFIIEIDRLRRAVTEMGTAGWLDGIDVEVVPGPSEYLFGEETALLEVMEGRPPFPRVTPPWRRGIDPVHHDDAHSAAGVALATEGGSAGAPALVDNVETLANVPSILQNGVGWFRSLGTEMSPGTIVCTVTGATRRHGVGEFELGTQVGDVIGDLGGGARRGRTIRFVLSGVSNPPLLATRLDTPLSYEAFAAAGSGLGSASFIVIDDSVSPRWVASEVARFLSVESCGQCEPCKRDGLALAKVLSTDSDRSQPDQDGVVGDLLRTVARGARCNLARQTEAVVGGILALSDVSFGDTPEIPAQEDADLMAIVPLVEMAGNHAVLDLSQRGKAPDWTYPESASSTAAWPIQRLADQPVQISPIHVAERAIREIVEIDNLAAAEVIGTLNNQLIRSITALENASDTDRPAARALLREELYRHLDLMERVVFPLLDRVRVDAADIAAYPDRHGRRAYALLSSASPDDAEAVRHAREAVDEVRLRVLPLLSSGMDAALESTVASALVQEAELLGWAPALDDLDK